MLNVFGQESDGLPAAAGESDTVVTVSPTSGDQPVPAAEEKPPKIDAFRSVNGLEQWKYDYDISGYAAGKYNLIIEGTDKAGNVYTEGPYNIIIDPESDLPITNISNPTPNLRVGGNLNIVGTCVDDDAVKAVELAIGDGGFTRAEGTDFWSYNLNTGDMLDGLYTIAAKGTDINGVEGRISTVSFNLDRYKPVFEITSHGNGDLVNGKIELKGTVSDRNGIAAVSYSSDGGQYYQALKFRGDRSAESAEFSLNIDTTKLPDGATIYWFEGRDNMGSVERTAFLFFVDNKAPQLTILFPTETDSVNGVFTISGKVADEVGVDRLTWQVGKEEPVEIPLRPGDPYWTQEFDYSGKESADVLLTLIDKTGNTTIERFKRDLDFQADLPTVTLITPAQGDMLKADRIAGFLKDDDGIKGIVYSIDGAQGVSVDTGQAFDLTPPAPLAPGSHKVAVRAVDINGLEGPAVEVGFTKAGDAPEITFATVTDSKGIPVPLENGIGIRTDVHKSLEGSISFSNPAGTATYSFAGSPGTPLPLKRDSATNLHSFSIPVPAETIPFGVVELLVEATDGYGFASREQVYLSVKNLTRNDEEHGIYFHDERLQRGVPVPVDRANPLRGRYIGYPVASVEFDPPTDIVTVRETGGLVEISPAKEGVTPATTLKITSDRGTVFSAGPFVFTTDVSPPELALDSGINSGRLRGAARLKGSVSDKVGGVSLNYKLGGEESRVGVTAGSFDVALPMGNLPEDGILLTVTAADDAGNTAVEYRVINRTPVFTPNPEAKKDPSPVVKVVYPAPGLVILPEDLVRGSVYAGGVVSGVERVAEIFYTLDQQEERSVPAGETFEVLLRDLEAGAHSISFRAVSGKGVSAQSAKISFQVAQRRPRVAFSGVMVAETETIDFGPGADLPVTESTRLIGTVAGGTSVSGTFSIDGAEPAKLSITPAENNESVFSIPLGRFAGYGRHEVSVEMTDGYGRTQSLSTFYHRVVPKGSRDITERDGLFIADPRFSRAGETVLLEVGETVTVLFSGRAIQEYELRTNTGIIDLRRQGDLLLMAAVSDGFMPGGQLVVVTEDREEYSTLEFSIRVDGKAPEIALERDITGEWVRDSMKISGNITDNLGVYDVSVAVNGQVLLTPLVSGGDGAQPLTDIPFAIEVPLSEIPEGNVTLSIAAADEAGHRAEKEYLLRRDATPPAVRQITPESGFPVNGLLTFSALSIDDGNIETAEFSGNGVDFLPVRGTSFFAAELDLNLHADSLETIVYRVTDQAGNIGLYTPNLNIDPESDKPVVQIQIPEDGTLIRSNFIVSGMVFDDDDVKTIYYKVDDGEFVPLAGGNNFEIELKLADLVDNRHTVEVKAEDLAGVESDIATMWFNVSTAEPRSLLSAPEISQTVKGVVEIRGESIDKNGIEEVFISFDNGNTFNHADGKESWSYSLDTRTLPDGTYSLLIRAVDVFGVDGLYTTLLNIDNTLPTLELTGFRDREAFADVLEVRGRVADTIGLRSVHIDVLHVIGDPDAPRPGQLPAAETGDGQPDGDGAGDNAPDAPEPVDYAAMFKDGVPVVTLELPPEEVVLENIDLSGIPPGLYSLQITAKDRADNVGYISRNFERIESVQINTIEILFPAQGERFAGEFKLQGRISAPSPPKKAALHVDGQLFAALDVNQDGYFTHQCLPENFVEPGFHTVMVQAELPDGEVLKTGDRLISCRETGPWVIIDNFEAGDFAANRPWIEGRAGYIAGNVPEDEGEAKAFLKQFEVTQIAYSVDNGKSFSPVKGDQIWRFRLETQNLPDGILNLMVRARFRNGDTAVAKTQLIVDDTRPEVKLLYPEEGMRFNETISLSGTAFDASGLTDVVVALRKGDKSQYAVPSFIQGLYIDAHFLGATYFETGAGLTFFDNNVKLSVFVGNSPSGGRFSGMVLGAKLLANIATIPYGYFFGPDWNFLSSSVAVGADFSLFTMEPVGGEDSKAIVLGAVVAQLELARVEIAQWNIFNSFSAYIEGQLWFISSDVEGGIMPKIAFGIRSEVF
ncbi:MAG: hypothetical protein JW852_02755 [Spirochaetales bacterium]|nr:hypothetical protein [Spirochaetales bacterium]